MSVSAQNAVIWWKMRVRGYADTQICRYADMQIDGYADTRICGYTDMRIRDMRTQRIDLPNHRAMLLSLLHSFFDKHTDVLLRLQSGAKILET